MKTRNVATMLVLALALLVGLAGCGGGGGAGGSTSSGGGGTGNSTGQLQVGLTDASGEFASVVLTIAEVRAVPTGDENDATQGLPVIATFDPPITVDVLDLQFTQEILGTATLPAGEYNQIRLVLTGDNYVTFTHDPDVRHELKVPSGQQSGLKILGHYEVEAGTLSAILLDFDPARAIVTAGNSGQYILKPTGIRIVEVQPSLENFGALSGSVLPEEAWDSAVVSVIPEGGTTPSASGGVNPEDGSFRAFVPAGTYYLTVSADGFPTFTSSTTWTVVVGAEVDVGVIDLTAPSPSPSPSASPEPSPEPSPTASPEPSPEPSPSASPEPSPEPSPTASPEPSPTASPEPSPSPGT